MGTEYRYVNLIATLWFWFYVIEGREEFHRMDALEFLENHPGLVRDMEFKPQAAITSLTAHLADGFRKWSVPLDRLKRVPVPEMSETVPAAVFGGLVEAGRGFDVYALAARLDGADPEKVAEHLDLLTRLGAVDVVTTRGDEKLPMPEYETVSLSGGGLDEIRTLLESYERSGSKAEFLEIRNRIAQMDRVPADTAPRSKIKSTPAIQLPPRSEWKDVSALYRYLVKEDSELSGERIASGFGVKTVGVAELLLGPLVKTGLVNTYMVEIEGEGEYRRYKAVKLPGTRSDDIADMLEEITLDPAVIDPAVIKKRIADIVDRAEEEKEPSDAKRPTPDENAQRTPPSRSSLRKQGSKPARRPHPAWKNIATMYRYLARKGAPVSAAKASSDFGVDNIAAVEGVLAALLKTGLVNRYTKSKGKDLPEPLYMALKLPGAQSGKVAGMLENITTNLAATDMDVLKGGIVNITDPVWADAFVDTIVKNATARAAAQEGRKTILAVDTSWVPDVQETVVSGLVQALDGLEDNAPVKVIRGTGAALAAKITAAAAENVPMSSVVVLAAKDTISSKEFAPIRASGDNDTDKAFVVGVDPKELTDASYVRLMEMLTMTMRLAFGQKAFSAHPDITVGRVNAKLRVLIPANKPIPLESVKKLCEIQQRDILIRSSGAYLDS